MNVLTVYILYTEDGTNLQASNCPTSGSGGNNCFAAFLALHMTPSSSAYLEVSPRPPRTSCSHSGS